ncbi:MAG: hypothetical protein HQM10_17570 [Candidatus Riflebacteria bacterium]|nr:hypothetical protein [Candidatus Riflebacteria bacterium]
MRIALSQWTAALSQREKKLLVFLAVFVPFILSWFLFTRPMLDKIDALKRGNRVLFDNSEKLASMIDRSKTLNEEIKESVFDGVTGILPKIEEIVRKSANKRDSAKVYPTDLFVGEKSVNAARIKFEGISVSSVSGIVTRILSGNYLIAEADLFPSPDKKNFDGSLVVWKKAEIGKN